MRYRAGVLERALVEATLRGFGPLPGARLNGPPNGTSQPFSWLDPEGVFPTIKKAAFCFSLVLRMCTFSRLDLNEYYSALFNYKCENIIFM